ncbi:hypothetical protein DFQ14_10141 [Halopolyspora algeriensis]|uniref:Uncharacterized protein n=1 Tax=Halopolyspora algeriensis TaxID=1500506 RepID=A0A368VXN4_9ACTN|nr:hypothetical protein [Halopolyspora algeriensis]RCW46705.1 hypothetical protein DFQ14_10141 [Halopolyspora algeriensis]TQM46730.1 hypothetical protein FHU43_3851 [Halopolyspora algeriensis]
MSPEHAGPRGRRGLAAALHYLIADRSGRFADVSDEHLSREAAAEGIRRCPHVEPG